MWGGTTTGVVVVVVLVVVVVVLQAAALACLVCFGWEERCDTFDVVSRLAHLHAAST